MLSSSEKLDLVVSTVLLLLRTNRNSHIDILHQEVAAVEIVGTGAIRTAGEEIGEITAGAADSATNPNVVDAEPTSGIGSFPET